MKYTPGLMVGQLSGKAGNTVASRNRNGSYFRTRTIPTLVTNPATAAVRAAFTGFSQAYRALSSFEQQSWIDLGTQLKRSNSLGQSYDMTGLQAYKSINQRLSFYGFTTLVVAPVLTPAADATGCNVAVTIDALVLSTTALAPGAGDARIVHVTSSAGVQPGDILTNSTHAAVRTVDHVIDATHVFVTVATIPTNGDTIVFTRPFELKVNLVTTPIPAGSALSVEMTAPLSAGVSRPSRSQFRNVVVLPAATATADDITSAYVTKFGALATGKALFFRLFYVNAEGFAGSPVEGRITT